MDARTLVAAIVVGCATTACALNVAPDPGDSTPTVSTAPPPINSSTAPDLRPGTNCMPLVTFDADAGIVTQDGYVCPEPSARLPDPISTLPSQAPGQFVQRLTSPR